MINLQRFYKQAISLFLQTLWLCGAMKAYSGCLTQQQLNQWCEFGGGAICVSDQQKTGGVFRKPVWKQLDKSKFLKAQFTQKVQLCSHLFFYDVSPKIVSQEQHEGE